ncbi:MMS19 nucleotide excision repair protein homolog [Branchiostoma lanceolatum]|uniref:MMS19 nucleotide excision repair protein homolog n=1 Tax=Branchiostoma lanceolatum TaxID=7740 RepID=UPI0034546FD3
MAALSGNVQENVLEFVQGQQDSALQNVAKAVFDGETSLLQLVESLGSSLTSTEVTTRARATQLLAEVLHRSPSNRLTEKEAEVLSAFFCDRLLDHHSVQPHVLHGLLALSASPKLPQGDEVKIVQVIFKEVYVQSLVQTDRRAVYNILANFLDSRLEALQTLGADFVWGFIQAMDGEKDPRNLNIAFSIARIAAQAFPIGTFTEELFEVVACYFPIDFTPPADDPHGVSREDLVLGLRQVLAATDKFAEFCVPMLLEKLSSDVTSAKLDSLHTLAACAEVYGAENLKSFLDLLLSAISREVYNSSHQDIENAALTGLTAVVATLSHAVTETGSVFSLHHFLDSVLKGCRHHLCEPELKLMWPSAKLLQAAARASDPACVHVLNTVVPLMVEQFQVHPLPQHRQTMLEVTTAFIHVAHTFTSGTDAPNPIIPHSDNLLTVFYSVLEAADAGLRSSGVGGMAAMMGVGDVVKGKHLDLCAKHLGRLVLHDADSTVQCRSTEALAAMATAHPDVIQAEVLSKLLEVLENNGCNAMDTNQREQVSAKHVTNQYVLNTLAAISTHPTIVRCTVPKLVNHLQALIDSSADEANQEAIATLHCIHGIVEKTVIDDSNVQYFVDTIVQNLMCMALAAAVNTSDRHLVHDTSLLDVVAKALRAVTQRLPNSAGNSIVGKTVQAFLDGNMAALGLNTSANFKPFDVSSPWQQTQTVLLLSAIVCSVAQNVDIPSKSELAKKLLMLSCASDHEPTSLAATKCLSGIVNKWELGKALEMFLQETGGQLEEMLRKTVDEKGRYRAVAVLVWLTKALVIRGHPSGSQFTKILMALFEDEAIGRRAAEGFHVILSDSSDVLCKESHANIRLMYRQRFFMENLPALVDGFNQADDGRKQSFLCAVSHLLTFMPRQVLLGALPLLVPLLVQSLLGEDPSLQVSTLEMFSSLVQEAPQVISQNIDALIPQLLELSKNGPSMSVRMAALKSLGSMTSLPHAVVYPYRNRVVRELALAVGDKKRMVRKEAVAARGEWFLLGSPGGK